MNYDQAREQLVDKLCQRKDLSEATVEAMREIPRHEFVPVSKQGAAYKDVPLPIGEGQTISAPHMVAIMTEILDLSPGDRVLEIGTGCGYHAAVTAAVVDPENVYSVEFHEELAKRARETLDAIGYGAISIRVGDGRDGWAEHAPYDAAYLTCAASVFPNAVVEQVNEGGVVLGPLKNGGQTLVRGTVGADGITDRTEFGSVRFVPLK